MNPKPLLILCVCFQTALHVSACFSIIIDLFFFNRINLRSYVSNGVTLV